MTDHIQVGAVAPLVQYVANGSQTAFTFRFPIFAAGDLEVWIGNVRQPATAYAISGVGISGGGTVLIAVPPADGALVTLRRRLAIQRTTDYQEDGIIRAKLLNDELDYQTAALQQVSDESDRAVKRSFLSTSAADLTLPEPSAGRAIKWSADGTALENSTADTDQVLAGAQNAAQAAAASATSAATSRSGADSAAAATSADAATATARAADASAAAGTAQASALSAAGSAATATTAATTTQAEAGIATSAAGAAQASAADAASSAAAASRSAGAAATSANAAAGSAVTATAGAASATTSATSASASAGAAQTYASLAQAASSGGAVRISATDTTSDFLSSSLVAGANIALSINNAGGNETLAVAVTGLGSAAALAVDTDNTLAAASDSRLPSQKAIRSYVERGIGGLQQDVIQNYLLDAVSGAWAAGQYSNGGFDAFNTDTIGANSTGQTYEAGGKSYDNPGGATLLASTGTLIGNTTANAGATANAFDGNASTFCGRWDSASLNTDRADSPPPISGNVLSLGMDWGASTPKSVVRYDAWVGSNSGTANTCPTYMQGSSDNSTWVTLTTTKAISYNSGLMSWVGSDVISTTAYRYHRMISDGPDGAMTTQCYTLAFYASSPPPGMTLVSSALSPAPASAPAQVRLMVLYKDMSGSAALNSDFTAEVTRDGATWTPGSLADTGLILAGYRLLSMVADVSAQPSGTTVKYRLKALNAKTQQVKGVALMTA